MPDPGEKPRKPTKERRRRFGWSNPDEIVVVKEPEKDLESPPKSSG